MGRIATYTQAIGNKICAGLAEGRSLRKVCLATGLPAATTVRDWIKDNTYPEFSEQYARARHLGYEALADELRDIADDDSKDAKSKQSTQRSRLMVDTRKWELSKMLPKVYGDKLTLAGDAENPIVSAAAFDTSKLSTEELEMYLELIRKMKSSDNQDSK